MYLYLGEDGYQYNDNAILKHSPNIIDLIEELVNEIDKLEQEKKDIEQDRDDNYKPLSYKELW